MITCSKCGKENQDHYKFCLGCGAELPRDAAPKPFAPRTPPHGMKAVPSAKGVAPAPAPAPMAPAPAPAPVVAAPPAPAPAPAPVPRPVAPEPPPVAAPEPPPPAPAGETVTCPQCGHVNSTAFKFCASCGYNLSKVAPVAAPLPPEPAPAPVPTAVGWKLTVLRADGTDAGTYDVPSDITVGRETGGIFGGDSYLSPKHAKLTVRGGKLFVQDAGSLNGTYVKLKREAPEPLIDGQFFRIGQEIIRFEKLHPEPTQDGVEKMGSPSHGYFGRIVLVTGRETDGNAFPVPNTGVHIGRERGHVLFPEDGYVSGLHCSLTVQNDVMTLTDLGSSNGTFVRLRGEREVAEGDILLMGQQLFRAGQ